MINSIIKITRPDKDYNDKKHTLLYKLTFFIYLSNYQDEYLDHLTTGLWYRYVPTINISYYSYNRIKQEIQFSYQRYYQIYMNNFIKLSNKSKIFIYD